MLSAMSNIRLVIAIPTLAPCPKIPTYAYMEGKSNEVKLVGGQFVNDSDSHVLTKVALWDAVEICSHVNEEDNSKHFNLCHYFQASK